MKGLVQDGMSRRIFLRGAGGALLALPFLESLQPKAAAAQAMAAPKRLIVFKSFSTQLIKQWYPAFTGNGYQLKNSKYKDNRGDGTTLLTQKLVSGSNYTWAPLADLKTDQGISGILGANLNPFLDKLTLIRGLDFLPSVNHNFGGLLGNFSSCTKATPCDADSLMDVPTIDQVLAYSPKFYQSTPGLRSLHVSQGVVDAMSYSDGGKTGAPVEQLKTRTNPRDVFNDLFAGLMADNGSGPPMPDPDALLVDRVVEQYRSLKQSSRLSADDKAKVEQHIGFLAEVEAKLSTVSKLSCVKPADPGSLDNNNGTDPTDIKKKWDLFLDLVVAGIACDRTRLVTIGVHKALGPGPDPADSKLVGHYHSEDASGGTWHGLAHDFGNENSRRMLAGINHWIAQELFAKLLEKLNVAEAGGETMLDNSLVYWGNELGFNHIAYSVPCLLAGSAGGYIKTGRYLDYIDWDGRSYFSQEDGNVIKGIPHNRFLVTLLQAMGLSPADYERDGQAGYGSTSTNGRDPSAWPTDYDLSNIGQVLPGIQG
ncbi:MAG TPA: DUF1552 domain-containing protein [Polyangiaceae bacterium]|nr:DUF1552 domain-containing protein [Polyangiaceae bacterium]